MYMTGSAGSVSANSCDGRIANSLQRMAKEMVACAVAEAVTTNLRHNPVCFFVWRNVDHNVHQSPSSSHRFPGVSLVHKCTRVSSWSHSILHLGVTATFGHLRERAPEVHWAFLSEKKNWTSDTKNLFTLPLDYTEEVVGFRYSVPCWWFIEIYWSYVLRNWNDLLKVAKWVCIILW